MDECFLYRNPPFSFPYAGLFNPLRNFHDNQFAITGPDGDGMNKKHDETRKRKEKKRMSQILYSDNRRQRLNERLRAKLENRKHQDEKLETKQANTILSEEDLVTLFDSKEEKPKKRKRKKRKNKKKKKNAENIASLDTGSEASSKQMEATAEAADIVSSPNDTEESIIEESVSPKIEVSSTNEYDELLSEGEKKEEDVEKVEESSIEKDEENEDGSVAGESAKGEHLSCGESSTSSIERSTSEHDDKEAGETVSNDEAEEQNEEERSTISPEERGHLTEMVLDDEFPWHLYQTDDDNFSRDNDDGFTVVKRKEKRPRKRKISPPRKKKRRGQRRHNRRAKEKKKEKEKPAAKSSTPIKNSPRNACPIRPVIQKLSKPDPPVPPNLKADPTQVPVPPPGFEMTANSQMNVPSLTKPFEQIQSVNAVFMKMPHDTIITIPFLPFDGIQEGPDICPMNLDLSYPLDCTIPYYVFPEQPIDYVPQQYG